MQESTDNGETHNDTPSESDRMDISEVSSQATPVSDQSPAESVDNQLSGNQPDYRQPGNQQADNQQPDNLLSNSNAELLDNAKSVAAAAAVAPRSTEDVFMEKMLRTTTATPNKSSTPKHLTSTATTMNETPLANRRDSLSNGQKDLLEGDQGLGNWSSGGGDSGLSREHSGSRLSLEGLDLELPTLEMYQEEIVDFPSSPTHENFQPLALSAERDSGNAGASEEDEEDTSIYRAVLSPNCQDVRLKKDVAVEYVDTSLPHGDKSPQTTRAIEQQDEDDDDDDDDLEQWELLQKQDQEPLPQEEEKVEVEPPKPRKIIAPRPEDAVLPDIGDLRNVVVEEAPPEPALKPKPFHKSSEGLAGMTLSLAPDDNLSDEENSDFVFERRNSKRLSRHELGERVMEGLFIESRNKDSGKRKISVPDDVINSPDGDSTFDSPEKEDDEDGEKPTPFERKIILGDGAKAVPTPAARVGERTVGENKTSSKRKGVDGSAVEFEMGNGPNIGRTPMPPCPKPRRRNPQASEGVPRPAVRALVLDPVALETCPPPRAVPRVNPDGSVDVEERPGSLISSQRGGRRKIRVTADILGGGSKDEEDTEEDGEGSSVGGGSSRLSDPDALSPAEDDADLDALLSPGIDTPDELEDSILEPYQDYYYQSPFVGLGEPPPISAPAPQPIPELTAAEERAESRTWRSCVVQGIERRIDMKVIEPYKRVLSHGGYLAAGSHNAIIVFSACFLPDRSRVDYDYVMDNLFLYVLTTLDQLITEDYVLIYLHGATQRSCMPTFSWLKRCYQLIDRRLRKNLKGLYLVHPTFWLKTIVLMTKPFISSKFSRKLRFVETLAELSSIVPLEQASIPDRVKQYRQCFSPESAKTQFAFLNLRTIIEETSEEQRQPTNDSGAI